MEAIVASRLGFLRTAALGREFSRIRRCAAYYSSQTPIQKKSLAEPTDEDEDLDKPIPYSMSKAAEWRVENTRLPPFPNAPWYQGIVVSLSLAVFLVYFCILREENDIDIKLSRPLSEYVEIAENVAEPQAKS